MASSVPDIWLCGTSARSALLAAELGVAYAYHHHQAARGAEAGAEIVRAYRRAFQPSAHLPAPRVNVACMGVCASTSSQAEAIWSATVGTYHLPPDFCGEPARCRDQLFELRDVYQVDELVISSCAREASERIASYRLLAAAQLSS